MSKQLSVLCLLLLFVLAVPLAFAGGQKEEKGTAEFDPGKKITLTVPVPSYYMSEAVNEAFMAKFPNIKLEIGQKLNASQDEAVFVTKAAAGDVDDVFGGGDENPDMYGPKGIYIDIKPWLEKDRDLWYDSKKFMHWWIYTNPDGAIYSVPLGGNPMVIFYNKDMLDAAGLEYPPETYADPKYSDWTWDRFGEYARALTNKEKEVWGVGIHNNILVYWPFIYSNGGRIVDKKLTDYLIDDPKVVETFDFLTSFTLNGYAPDPSAAQEFGGLNDLFLNDRLAMWVEGAWNAGGAYHPAELELGKRIGIATLPYKTVKKNIVLSAAMRMGISSFAENPEAAYRWLKFVYFESDELWLSSGKYSDWMSVLPRVDLARQLYDAEAFAPAAYGTEKKDLSFLQFDHSSPEMLMTDPPWNGPFPETRDITLAEMGLVFSGEQTLDQAIARINEQADQVMERWQRSK